MTTSERTKVYVTRPLPQKGLDLLLGRCNVSFWDSPDPAPRTELFVNVPGIDVLVCMPTDKIDRDVLNAAGPSLKIVATLSEDAEHIETAECSRRNIRILTLPPVTMDFVTSMVLALVRLTTVKWMGPPTCNLNLLLQAKDLVEAIKGDHTYCLELSNRTVGIVGLGQLGMTVGKALQYLGATTILYHDVEPVSKDTEIGAEFVDREELLKRSDIICVCKNIRLSGTDPVLFNKSAFKQMKNSAILIDATKGLSADFGDLYEALRGGEIAAAGLDIREYDGIPNRHPLVGLENCFFLPFRECYKWDGRRKLSVDLAKSILSTMQDMEFEEKSLQTCPKPVMIESRGLVALTS